MPAQPLNRICYVEDDEDIQRIVRMSLERVGKMTVEVVSDPMVAIERMIAFKPELVMLDWMMPGHGRPDAVPQDARDAGDQGPAGRVHHRQGFAARAGRAASAGRGSARSRSPSRPKDLPDQLRAIWTTLP